VEDQLWLCFFRGLNVFGRGRISMFELERRCQAAFADSGLPILGAGRLPRLIFSAVFSARRADRTPRRVDARAGAPTSSSALSAFSLRRVARRA
jgi:hypothetical protein